MKSTELSDQAIERVQFVSKAISRSLKRKPSLSIAVETMFHDNLGHVHPKYFLSTTNNIKSEQQRKIK